MAHAGFCPPRRYLLECFDYDAISGVLRWKKERPIHHFSTTKRRAVWNKRYGGKISGCQFNTGYIVVGVCGKRVGAHRIAYVIMHGDILSDMDVDHINGIRSCNVGSNLRLATKRQNAANSKIQSRNTSGYTGVHWCKRDKSWIGSIRHLNKRIIVARNKDKNIVMAARRDAELRIHGDFAAINGVLKAAWTIDVPHAKKLKA